MICAQTDPGRFPDNVDVPESCHRHRAGAAGQRSGRRLFRARDGPERAGNGYYFNDFIEADFPGVVVRSGNRPDGRLIDQLSVRFVTQFRYPGSAFFTIGLQHR